MDESLVLDHVGFLYLSKHLQSEQHLRRDCQVFLSSSWRLQAVLSWRVHASILLTGPAFSMRNKLRSQDLWTVKRTECEVSYLFHLLVDGVESLVLGLGVGQDVARLTQLVLKLQHPLLVVGLLARRLLEQRLLTALPVRRHLPVVGVGLSKGLCKRGTVRVKKHIC